MQQFGITLRHRHGTLRLVSHTSGIEQRGQVVVITDTLGGTILGRACTIPETNLIAELPTNHTMYLHTQVEACTYAWRNGIERIRQNGLGSE